MKNKKKKEIVKLMTKKIYQEIMSQATASTKKLATQLNAYPYNAEEVRKSLDEVIKYVNKDIKDYEKTMAEETGEVKDEEE